MSAAEDLVRAFVDAYTGGDRERMTALLAPDVRAYVTNGEGGVDQVDGAQDYLSRLPALDDATISLTVTQSVTVEPGRSLSMVEVRARRGESTLHNYAAFLARARDGLITELWMVDALPAESDAFWQ